MGRCVCVGGGAWILYYESKFKIKKYYYLLIFLFYFFLGVGVGKGVDRGARISEFFLQRIKI